MGLPGASQAVARPLRARRGLPTISPLPKTRPPLAGGYGALASRNGREGRPCGSAPTGAALMSAFALHRLNYSKMVSLFVFFVTVMGTGSSTGSPEAVQRGEVLLCRSN